MLISHQRLHPSLPSYQSWSSKFRLDARQGGSPGMSSFGNGYIIQGEGNLEAFPHPFSSVSYEIALYECAVHYNLKKWLKTGVTKGTRASCSDKMTVILKASSSWQNYGEKPICGALIATKQQSNVSVDWSIHSASRDKRKGYKPRLRAQRQTKG